MVENLKSQAAAIDREVVHAADRAVLAVDREAHEVDPVALEAVQNVLAVDPDVLAVDPDALAADPDVLAADPDVLAVDPADVHVVDWEADRVVHGAVQNVRGADLDDRIVDREVDPDVRIVDREADRDDRAVAQDGHAVDREDRAAVRDALAADRENHVVHHAVNLEVVPEAVQTIQTNDNTWIQVPLNSNFDPFTQVKDHIFQKLSKNSFFFLR